MWLAEDADIDLAKKYIRPRRNFLGHWKWEGYPKLKREIELTSNRTFVVRQDWLPKLKEILEG